MRHSFSSSSNGIAFLTPYRSGWQDLTREWPKAQDTAGIVAGTSSFDSLSMQIDNSEDMGYSVYFTASMCESMSV